MTTEIYVGLDIGTTKVVCLIAEKDGDKGLSVIAKGESKSDGLRRGVIVNIESTAKAIRQAVQQAEQLSGIPIKEVYVGIAGDHISSKTSSGMIAISGPNKIVNRDDVRRVIEAAKTISLPNDREVIHVIPLEYGIDGQEGIFEPVGMAGTRLTAEIHMITASKAAMQNLKNAVTKAGLTVKEFVLEPLASAHAILSDDEKNLGVCMIDIGGGTTDIAMYYEGALRYTAIVPIGGYNVTSDLSQGLRTTVENAEIIKTNYGVAHIDMVEGENEIEVKGVGGREAAYVSQRLVSQIIQPRMEEIFSLCLRSMQKCEYFEMMNAGVVLTGGASMLRSSSELASQYMDMPAKIGVPKEINDITEAVDDPKYATAVGLVKYAAQKEAGKIKENFLGQLSYGKGSSFLEKMKKFIDDLL